MEALWLLSFHHLLFSVVVTSLITEGMLKSLLYFQVEIIVSFEYCHLFAWDGAFSPALQAESSLSESPGKPFLRLMNLYYRLRLDTGTGI